MLTHVSRRRLDELSTSSPSPRGAHNGVAVTVDELASYYSDLEETARFKVMSVMDRVLGHVSDERKHEFLSSIMLVSFSNVWLTHFQGTLFDHKDQRTIKC